MRFWKSKKSKKTATAPTKKKPEPQHLKAVTDTSVELFATPHVIDTLAGMKIYFGRDHNRFRPNVVLHFPLAAQVEPYTTFAAGARLSPMGSFSYSNSSFPSDMSVGRYCSIANNVALFGDRHPLEWITTSSITYDFGDQGYPSFRSAHNDFNDGDFELLEPEDKLLPPPRIEDDVWIGRNVLLARNISIGTGSVIAAGAVVTKDVPPFSVVGGVPAKVIRMRFPDHIIERIIKSRWWRYDPRVLNGRDFRNPEAFLDCFEASPPTVEFQPEAITADLLIRTFQTLPETEEQES